MAGSDYLRRSRQRAGGEDAAAANEDQRNVAATQLYPIHHVFEHASNLGQTLLDEAGVQVSNGVGVAHPGETAGDGEVAGRQCVATEYVRLLGKTMADA